MVRSWDFKGGITGLVWSLAPTVPGRSPARWRLDAMGSPILRLLRGQSAGLFSYQLDHITPPMNKLEQGDPWFRSVFNVQMLSPRVNKSKSNRTNLTRTQLELYQHYTRPSKCMMDCAEVFGYGDVLDENENVIWKSYTILEKHRGFAKVKVPHFEFPPCVCHIENEISVAHAVFLKKLEDYGIKIANIESESARGSSNDNQRNERLSALLKSWEELRGLAESKLAKLVRDTKKVSTKIADEPNDTVLSHEGNAGDVKKPQDAGIYTCNGLMMHSKKLKSVVRITTGSQALDELLGGGIETLCITEAFGEFRSGKTQLAHTLCVSTQLPIHMHEGNGKVAYIDTEGTFQRDSIMQIAERFGMDANAVLDNIIHARAYTYEHQCNLLSDLAAKMAEEPFSLLVVDSLSAVFRVDFSGTGELGEQQKKLGQMLLQLNKIAEKFNVAVFVTNEVMADPAGGMFITDPKKPAGGHVLANVATIRLMLRKGKGEQRVCKIFDAPNLPEGEAVFQVTAGGITDAKD